MLRQLRTQSEDFLVGVVGEVVERKGHIHLFKALPKIIEAIPNFKLVLLGRFNREEPYVKKLRRLVLKKKLYCQIKWLGLRSNVPDFMAAFDLTVVPSIEEPLGLVALESLAAGTAVVASDTGGLPEIIQHQKSGLIVPPRRPAALAEAIIEMYRDPERRKAMGVAGREFVLENFDPQHLSTQVEAVYEKVLGKHKQARQRAA